MGPGYVVLIIFGIALIIGFVIYAHNQAIKKRREALTLFASKRGMKFTPRPDKNLVKGYPVFFIFSIGRGQRASNLMEGVFKGVSVTMFDFIYTIGSGKHTSHHTQTVICFENPEGSIPNFQLRPEHFFHKIGSKFGLQDIDFGHFPGFSKNYLLKSDNEKKVREVFSSSVLYSLEKTKGISLESLENKMLFYRAGKTTKKEEIENFLEEGFEITGLFRK